MSEPHDIKSGCCFKLKAKYSLQESLFSPENCLKLVVSITRVLVPKILVSSKEIFATYSGRYSMFITVTGPLSLDLDHLRTLNKGILISDLKKGIHFRPESEFKRNHLGNFPPQMHWAYFPLLNINIHMYFNTKNVEIIYTEKILTEFLLCLQ